MESRVSWLKCTILVGKADLEFTISGSLFVICRLHHAQVSFLPLTHYVLSVSLDGFIKQWDVDRQVLIKVFACGAAAKGGGLGGAPLLALCLSADGDYFCCCDSSRQLHLWRRTEEQVFAEEQQEKRLLQQQLLDSEGFDAAAANTAAAAAATAATVVLDRPTRRTDEVLRTADKLIEVCCHAGSR